MAISSVTSGCKLHIEAVQTVVPTKPTDPRQSLRVVVPGDHLSSTLFQRRFHVLLCYNKALDEDSGWLVAGRIKESLGSALQEHPLLAGRLRQCEESGVDLEIVSNDSGVRLVEGKIEMKLVDFLELNEKGEAAELVFWEDVVAHNPQFCPLFYVQVTNFSCGGYSIGISCSLLLVDPFVLTSFLKKWAKLHDSMVSRIDMPKIPTFYLPNLGKLGTNPTLLMRSNTGKNAAESVIFKNPTTTLDLYSNIHKNLAELYINEAELKFGWKMATKFSLFLKLPSDDVTVEICSRQGLLESLPGNVNGLTCARLTWDELGLDGVCFNQGKKPSYASCGINSVLDEGSVMIIPSSDVNTSGTKILVTFT